MRGLMLPRFILAEKNSRLEKHGQPATNIALMHFSHENVDCHTHRAGYSSNFYDLYLDYAPEPSVAPLQTSPPLCHFRQCAPSWALRHTWIPPTCCLGPTSRNLRGAAGVASLPCTSPRRDTRFGGVRSYGRSSPTFGTRSLTFDGTRRKSLSCFRLFPRFGDFAASFKN